MTDHDPLRDLWATDTGDKFTMSISDLTARSNRFQSRIERRNLSEYIAAVLVVGVFGWLAFIVPVWSIRLGAILIIAAALFVSWNLRQIGSVSATPNTASAETLASHHRGELVRQRDALKSVWRWYLLPFVPGILVFMLATTFETGSNLPIWVELGSSAISLSLMGGLFYGIYALNAQAAKKLDREIDALESVMKG